MLWLAQHSDLKPAEFVRVAPCIFSYTEYLTLASPNACHVSEIKMVNVLGTIVSFFQLSQMTMSSS